MAVTSLMNRERPMISRHATLVAVIAVAGCTGNTLQLEGTSWRSLAKQDGKVEIPEGAEKFTFESGGRFTHESGGRQSGGTYRTGSRELSLKYDSHAIWDPGTVVGYTVTMDGDRMVLRQAAGDGPALTTMGRVIEFKRVE
jgi:hypothetical protein